VTLYVKKLSDSDWGFFGGWEKFKKIHSEITPPLHGVALSQPLKSGPLDFVFPSGQHPCSFLRKMKIQLNQIKNLTNSNQITSNTTLSQPLK
jgi:hypothetical protein